MGAWSTWRRGAIPPYHRARRAGPTGGVLWTCDDLTSRASSREPWQPVATPDLGEQAFKEHAWVSRLPPCQAPFAGAA